MRFRFAALVLLFIAFFALATQAADAGRSARATPAATDHVTVPATIDHNRIVIEVDVLLPDGSAQHVRAWVDNGNPEFTMSRRLATALGATVTCGQQECSSPPPAEIRVGGLAISVAGVKEAKIPLKAPSAASVLAPGIKAEINIPSTVLRHYDVLIDYPGRKFSIGPTGSIHFLGSSSKVQINADNGLIQVPSKMENKKYNLSLDLGSSISFLDENLYDALSNAHQDWPHMTGAVGSANLWGQADEAKWKLMRVDRVQYGPLFLTDVPVVDFPKEKMEDFNKRSGVPTAGLLGADVFQNYRIGLDYAHSMVYFDIGRLFNFPEFDLVGLVLRPEDDGRYTVLGIADYEGKPSLPTGPDGVQVGDHVAEIEGVPVQGRSMGQVWAMLMGNPGQERKLTIERGGKQFVVSAKVQHFLAVQEDTGSKKR